MSKDKVGAFIILALSVAYGAMALNLPDPPGRQDSGVTPSSLPIAISIAGIAVSALILILPVKPKDDKVSAGTALTGLNLRRASVLFLLMIGYGLTIKPLGFLISTAIFLCCGFWVMGEQRLPMILTVSFGATTVFWFILTQLLNTYLEPGIIFDILLSD